MARRVLLMAARLSALCLNAATLTRQLCGFPAHSKQHEKGCCFYRNETGNTQQKQVAKFTKEMLSTEDIWKRLERSYKKNVRFWTQITSQASLRICFTLMKLETRDNILQARFMQERTQNPTSRPKLKENVLALHQKLGKWMYIDMS